ncbi:MAG: hypothetical protein K1X61_00145 [Chitinophagales bacterium]|nr:hypothetical protein [Chitinophagales bacterium]
MTIQFFMRPFVLLMLMITLTVACEQHEPEDVLLHMHNATIRVSVNLLQGGVNGQLVYIPISGATAELYSTEDDRDNSTEMVAVRNSDSAGLAVFTGLKEDYYYLRVYHPAYGTVYDETATPDGSVSLVQIDF